MKFLEEQPNDEDVVEIFNLGKWRKVTYHWGVIGFGYIEDEDTGGTVYLDDHPDMEWRYIEGHDLSAVESLPPKNEVTTVTLRVHSSTPVALDEFVDQFGATMSDGDFEAEVFLIEVAQEKAPYLAQQIMQESLGWDIEEAKDG